MKMMEINAAKIEINKMDEMMDAEMGRVNEIIGILGPINALGQTCADRNGNACPDTLDEHEAKDLMVAFSLALGVEVTGCAAMRNERGSEWRR